MGMRLTGQRSARGWGSQLLGERTRAPLNAPDPLQGHSIPLVPSPPQPQPQPRPRSANKHGDV